MRSLSAFVLSILVLLSGCSPGVVGNGKSKTEFRSVSDFNEIVFKLQGDLQIQVGDAPTCEITADDNLLPLIDVRVNGSQLEISPRESFTIRTDLRFKIAAPSLRGLVIDGAGRATLSGVDAERFDITLNGAGAIAATGKAKRLTATLGGAGRVDLSGLAIEDGVLTLNGTGSIDADVSHQLDATINGAGTIRYRGSAVLHRAINGVGSISHR